MGVSFEIHLIGQNVNSYRPLSETGLEGFSGATPFSRLLRAVAATGLKRIKFTTSFPRDFHFDIVSALDENDNLCNWVHLPVQSGSDRVLKAMRRGYCVSDYLDRVKFIKNAKRRLSLTTDIIVGFPDETSEDFIKTIQLVEECRFDGLYIFKYSERSRTKASLLLDDVPESEKTARFLHLESVQKVVQEKKYSQYIGTTVEVLVEGLSAKSKQDMTGHTTCNKVVNFKGDAQLTGQLKQILITDIKSNSLYGEIVQ